MAKYRKKPLIIEAEQFKSYTGDLPDGVVLDDHGFVYVETSEGIMHVSLGDWIITGVEGERYPCKPSVFEKTYEKVEE